MNRMKIADYKKSKGFSLIEVLIATSILLIGILSAFALVSRSLASVPVIQDRLVASFLAQEKIEEIRRIRDGNFLEILHGKDSSYWTLNILSCDEELSDKKTMNGTDFTRTVLVKQGDPNIQLIIQCTVAWERRGHKYSFVTEDHLFNWIDI